VSAFTIERRGDLVRLAGRFDASQVEKAKPVFDALSGPTEVDCSALEYISSAGISVLLTAHKRLKDSGHPLRLRQVSQRIRNVFQYAGLDRIFTLE
jgi:anti-sigma B factor antagonist